MSRWRSKTSSSHARPPPTLLLHLLPTLFFLLLLHPTHLSLASFQQRQQQQPITNIIILVLENRSFDHMLGWMKKYNIAPSIDGLRSTECNRRSTLDHSSPSICVSDDARFVDPDPGHSFEAVRDQVFGSTTIPTMSGFVEQALAISPETNLSETVMRGFSPANLPVFAALVREFAVFDRWFSSVPGPTQPNRLFVFSATSHGATSHVKTDMAFGYPQKTIFDSLHENGVDFGIYSQSIPSTLFFRNLRRLRYVFKFHKFSTFKRHAARGDLRRLSVIEPRYFDLLGSPANDDHPSHDIAEGQRLVKEVYEAVRSSPQWNRSLLVITYDEHGGFYDHVVTPFREVPSPDLIRGPEPFRFGFDRLGVRVPTIMVSPWIKKGTVVRRPANGGPSGNSEYEHSSIPATIKKMFNLKSDFLTRRDAWAGTFEHVVSELTSPRTDCPEVLPNPVPLRSTEAKENGGLSELQSEFVQLAADLTGDERSFLSSSLEEESETTTTTMTVKEASAYVDRAFSMFLRAGKEALRLGAHESDFIDLNYYHRRR